LRPHRSAVAGRIFFSEKISTGQFATFATISALSWPNAPCALTAAIIRKSGPRRTSPRPRHARRRGTCGKADFGNPPQQVAGLCSAASRLTWSLASRAGNQFLRIRVARCFVNLVRWSLICPGQVAPAATCAIGGGAEPPGSLGGSSHWRRKQVPADRWPRKRKPPELLGRAAPRSDRCLSGRDGHALSRPTTGSSKGSARRIVVTSDARSIMRRTAGFARRAFRRAWRNRRIASGVA